MRCYFLLGVLLQPLIRSSSFSALESSGSGSSCLRTGLSSVRPDPLDVADQKLDLLERLDGLETSSAPDHSNDPFDHGHDNLMLQFGR